MPFTTTFYRVKNSQRTSGCAYPGYYCNAFRSINSFLQGFTQPHDVTSDNQDGAVYVADIGSNTVWKFKRPRQNKA